MVSHLGVHVTACDNLVECPRCSRLNAHQEGTKRCYCVCGATFGVVGQVPEPTIEQKVTSEVTEMALEMSGALDATRAELAGWKRAFVRLGAQLDGAARCEAACIVAGLSGEHTSAVLRAYRALGDPDSVYGSQRPEEDTWPR